MKKIPLISVLAVSVLAIAVATGWAPPAHAEAVDTDPVLHQEIAAMKAQMAEMAGRIATLEAQLAASRAPAMPATAAAAAAAATASAAAGTVVTASAPPSSGSAATQIAWKGAPEYKADGGWSFKPRGRLQLDSGYVAGPSGLASGVSGKLGESIELRRAYLGFDGTLPGGFTYRTEIDVAGSSVSIADLFLTYKAGKDLTLTLGNQKPNWGLDELTSDLLTSFMERGDFTQAFGFERRVGLNAQYARKQIIAQLGVFSDDPSSLNSDTDKSWSVDGRLVAMPRLGGGTLHLGGSVHYRDPNNSTALRYEARPLVHTTDQRFVSATVTNPESELGLGIEAAWIKGRFHAAAENYWQKVARSAGLDPTFSGGYAELGYMLTDDLTAYKDGAWDRIKPRNGLDKGGIGAVQVNARYSWLDLNDAGILGGRQRTAAVSALWIPTDYVRFILEYGHIWENDSPVTVNGGGNYGLDSLGMRAQFDF